ncbi:hypothetical protein [Streptomyces flavofungini]|uniref:Asp23/Gls24 family envelope stress response protein n=1 Tax=Streptomyces flavofungini TaxID=68200 RepID=A0ABS0XA51_9ACTN|nr:hypothetical protein [Streptomyces flavofungini]MBJ3810089.1 hypothetical protein [Streptomyces flavofungini]GHC81505.1 hypothetical protein GCM10010349_64650 [Streptomyces flavofungini]
MAMNEGGAPGGTSYEDVPEDEVLSCGRELAQVWEQAETGEPDPHTAGCPHCAEALRALRSLEAVVARARDDEPQERPWDTAALAGRVMDVVRLELRPGRTLPLGEADEDAWIVEAAAARTFRAAVESLPGVRAGSCRIEADPQDTGRPASAPPVGWLPRGPARVRIEVQVGLSWNLQLVADEVRARIVAAADRELGMRVAAVDVVIADLLDDAGNAGNAGNAENAENAENADTEGRQG